MLYNTNIKNHVFFFTPIMFISLRVFFFFFCWSQFLNFPLFLFLFFPFPSRISCVALLSSVLCTKTFEGVVHYTVGPKADVSKKKKPLV